MYLKISREASHTFATGFSHLFLNLRSMSNVCVKTDIINHNSNQCKLTAIISDVARFKSTGKYKQQKYLFWTSFSSKGLNAINLDSIIHHKIVQSKIYSYFIDPKYREPKSVNWKQNCKILMDSLEILPCNYLNTRTKTQIIFPYE